LFVTRADSGGETAWPRDRDALSGPKVIALHRTDRGRFALDEAGEWQPSNRATVVTARVQDASVAYLCGLLNSELLDLWYAVRGRVPWHVRRDYEPKPMKAMPYRHVPHPSGWIPGPEVAEMQRALESGDTNTTVEASERVRASIGSPTGDADAVAAIEHLVRTITSNRIALLRLREVAPELSQAVKSPWRTGGVTVDPAAILAEHPAAEVRSVRVDPTLTVTFATDGVLGRARLESGALVFSHARKPTARVEGPDDRLALLAKVVQARRLMPDDLRSTKIPLDLDAFAARVGERQREIDDLLVVGRALVEAVERIVCRLYGVPDPLAELVVLSAVARSGMVAQPDD
jgi:hypothetical protein